MLLLQKKKSLNFFASHFAPFLGSTQVMTQTLCGDLLRVAFLVSHKKSEINPHLYSPLYSDLIRNFNLSLNKTHPRKHLLVEEKYFHKICRRFISAERLNDHWHNICDHIRWDKTELEPKIRSF